MSYTSRLPCRPGRTAKCPASANLRVGGLGERRARAWNQFPFTVCLKCHDRTRFVAHFGRTRSPFERARNAPRANEQEQTNKSKRTRSNEQEQTNKSKRTRANEQEQTNKSKRTRANEQEQTNKRKRTRAN